MAVTNAVDVLPLVLLVLGVLLILVGTSARRRRP